MSAFLGHPHTIPVKCWFYLSLPEVRHPYPGPGCWRQRCHRGLTTRRRCPRHRQKTINDKKAKVIYDLNNCGAYRSNCYLNRIIKEFSLLVYKCSKCSIKHWNDKQITLELDHIDGDPSNCKITNLRYMCPNCHSQTDTYKGRNLNTGKIKVTDEQLMRSLKEHKNTRRALIEVGLSPRGGNYARVARLLTKID